MRRDEIAGSARSSAALSNRYDAGSPRVFRERQLRFDDSLSTILSADMASGFGAESTWRQLVDLMGRGRIASDAPAIARLRMLRPNVPVAVRAASARALAFASPDAGLVGFFAEDELAIAAPILRTVSLPADDWLSLLSRLSPAGRSVLRNRRDLPTEVVRGLQSLGSVDFALHDETQIEAPAQDQPVAPPDTPLSESPFVALGAIARGLPVVAEALRHAEVPQSDHHRFEISDLVARIEAFNRRRTTGTPAAPPTDLEPDTFRYETDDSGVIRWIEGVARGALIGVSLAFAAQQGEAQIDGVATGAYRRRSSFTDARLQVGGVSDAAGSWRLSGVPAFDRDTGRFIGFRGAARRPRADESAEPSRVTRSATSDSLRQLVHELRTPTNAIAGFAELIETELLGSVPEPYRGRAAAIRAQASDLLAAIDDLDMAARIEGQALDLRATTVPAEAVVLRAIQDLEPLARLRGAVIALSPTDPSPDIAGDDRAVERLIGRLMAALVSAGSRGERIGIRIAGVDTAVAITIDRPRALAAHAPDALLSIDAESEAEQDGAPLLGTGFALRLAQNLATELGGGLAIDADRLTLRLPAAVDHDVGQASTI